MSLYRPLMEGLASGNKQKGRSKGSVLRLSSALRVQLREYSI